MRKSKYVFLVFAVVYVLIYILDILNVVTVNENTLFGLTLSAFWISLSDVCNHIATYRYTRNELGYICQITSNVLQEYIPSGVTQTPIVINLKKNVAALVPNYKLMIHPNEFLHNRTNRIIGILENGCFVLSIAFFVLTPYLVVSVNQQISICLTLLAFSTMCFNIFILDIIADYMEKKNNFMNNTQITIQSFVPEFNIFLNRCLFYEESFEAYKNKENGV